MILYPNISYEQVHKKNKLEQNNELLKKLDT